MGGRFGVSVLLLRSGGSALLRTGRLTPYAAEVIAKDALRAAKGGKAIRLHPGQY